MSALIALQAHGERLNLRVHFAMDPTRANLYEVYTRGMSVLFQHQDANEVQAFLTSYEQCLHGTPLPDYADILDWHLDRHTVPTTSTLWALSVEKLQNYGYTIEDNGVVKRLNSPAAIFTVDTDAELNAFVLGLECGAEPKSLTFTVSIKNGLPRIDETWT